MASLHAPEPPRADVFVAVRLVLARPLIAVHYDMDLNPTVPIEELKTELSTQLGLEGSQQQWFYRNQLLDDRDTLERAGIIRSSSIEVRPLPDLTPSSFHPSAPAELSAEALRNRSSREV